MTAEIRSDHRQRRSWASASRKLGVAFFWYQGRVIQVIVVPKLGMYHVQIAALIQGVSRCRPLRRIGIG